MAIFIQRLIDHVPGEHLTGIMFHHCGDVLFQKRGQLAWREVALRKPLGIVVIPYQAVAANLHAMSLGELDDFIATAKVERALVPTHGPPFHRIFGLDHVKFARQGFRVSSFR